MIRPQPKPVARFKVDPRWKRPHRFEEAHDDPAPASVCWHCLKPRNAKVHQARAPMRRSPDRRVDGKRVRKLPESFHPAFPKPIRKPKAKRWGVSRRKLKKPAPDPQAAKVAWPKPTRPAGTKHRRRAREFGFMAFCHDRGCELRGDAELQRILGIRHDCDDAPIEFAHLHDRRRYAPGDIGAGLDRTVHLGIDGKLGGKATWYVVLDYTGQNMVRMRLANRARAEWNALTPEQRAEWDRKAEAECRARR